MKYLDISQYQTGVDYKVASEGLDGVMLRAGFGKGHDDTMFRTHYEGFSKFGIPIGIYWFSYALNTEDAANEARYAVSAIHGLKIELPVCFDFEDDSVAYARNMGVKINKPIATKIADAFLSTIEQNGYYAMLYANPNFLRNYYGDLSRYDLWLAHWGISEPSQKCGIWQYGTGKWNGFKSEVDLDECYNDYPTIIRNAGLNHLPEPEPPEPAWYKWATEDAGILLKDEVDIPATKGDVAQMMYQYFCDYGPEDFKDLSGLTGLNGR